MKISERKSIEIKSIRCLEDLELLQRGDIVESLVPIGFDDINHPPYLRTLFRRSNTEQFIELIAQIRNTEEVAIYLIRTEWLIYNDNGKVGSLRYEGGRCIRDSGYEERVEMLKRLGLWESPSEK